MKLLGLWVCTCLLAFSPAHGQTGELARKSQQAHELMAAGKVEQAIPIYRELVKASPNNAGLQLELGMALHRAGRDREAILLMAEAHVESQQYKSAFYLCQQALARIPDLRGVHTQLAEIYRQTGHSDWAVTEQEKEKDLPAPDCAARKAACELIAGHYADAIAAAGSHDTPEALYWRTQAYNALANKAYAKLQQLPPSVESHKLTAMLRRNQGRHREEVDEWREALKLAPNDPAIETQLALALIQMGDHEAARTTLQALEPKYPDSPIINYLLGDTFLKLQQPTQGIPS